MSKMDGLRAMREARYEAAQKAGKKAGEKATTPKPAPQGKAKAQPAVSAEAPAVAAGAAGEELCGHKAISGRTCTREKGHSAKSHRYA